MFNINQNKMKIKSLLFAFFAACNCWGQSSYSGNLEVIDGALYVINGSEKVLMSYVATIQGEENVFTIANGTTEIAPNAIRINTLYNVEEEKDHQSHVGASGISWAWAYGFGYTFPEISSILIEIPSSVQKIGTNAISVSDNVSVTYQIASTTTRVKSVKSQEDVKVEKSRYNLQGVPVNKDDKGIQIVVYSDNTTKTVVAE